MQTHFSADMAESVRLEVRRSHPVLECAEDVLDCPPPYRDGIEMATQSGLPRFKYRFMLPSSNRPSALAPEVCVFGNSGTTPASLHTLISGAPKYPRPASALIFFLPIASRAALAIGLNCARSLPTFLTSWITMR